MVCRALKRTLSSLWALLLSAVIMVVITLLCHGNLLYMSAAALGSSFVVMVLALAIWRGENSGDVLVWSFWGAGFSSEMLLAATTLILFTVYGNTPVDSQNITFLIHNFWYMSPWEYAYLMLSDIILLFAYEWVKAYLLTRRSSGRRSHAAA